MKIETETVEDQSATQALLYCPFCGASQDDFAGMFESAFATCSDGTYSINCGECNSVGPAGKTM